MNDMWRMFLLWSMVVNASCSPVIAVNVPEEYMRNEGHAFDPQAPWLKKNLLWSQGKGIALGCFAVGAVGLLLSSKLITLAAAATFAFSLYFFRNPQRSCGPALSNNRLLVSPADGKIVEIVEIEDGFVGEALRISIFLSPFDVHVQWIPLNGRIEQVLYQPGAFLVAYAPKSSDLNERNDIYVTTESGSKVVVRQIAGFVARRICCWVDAHTAVHVGEKYGMIRFGSRVDLIVPRSASVHVKIDDRVYGGETIIGELNEKNASAIA
jgi:phosphatidylserine decarboxylase